MDRETVAKILIFNEKGQILMLRRSVFEGYPERSHKPDLPGGLVDPDESERHAVVREVVEETGITLDPNKVVIGFAKTKYYKEENSSITKLLYITKLDDTPDVTISWEHEAYEWHSLDGFLQAYEMSSFYKKAIEYIQTNKLIPN